MWVCLNNAFLSIVQKEASHSETLTVRARRRGDIERVFPMAPVVEGAGTDYPFRAEINRYRVADAIAQSVRDIDYDNFKSSVTDQPLHDAYMSVWSVMLRTQEGHAQARPVDDLFDYDDDIDGSEICPDCDVSLVDIGDDCPYCPVCGEIFDRS